MAEQTRTKEEDLALFLDAGIDKRRAEETLKNAALTTALREVLLQAKGIEGNNMKENVNLFYNVATTLPANSAVHRPKLVEYIANNKINKNTLNFAIAYLKKIGSDELNISEFEKECGVGIVVTKEDITKTVSDVINEKKAELIEQRYHFPTGPLLATLREKLKWANQKDLKDEFDAQILALLGPKTAADNEKPKKKEAPVKETKDAKKATSTSSAKEEPAKELITFPDPKENKQATPDILEKHLKTTGGVVVCRFPPEPNGFLHIGHAKSMNLNFGYPKKSGGFTYLRYDDTNPEA